MIQCVFRDRAVPSHSALLKQTKRHRLYKSLSHEYPSQETFLSFERSPQKAGHRKDVSIITKVLTFMEFIKVVSVIWGILGTGVCIFDVTSND